MNDVQKPLGNKYLVLNIGTHYFAANVHEIEDVIRTIRTTPVPLAKDNIKGLLNLRGHIVTEINVSKILGIENISKNPNAYTVVVIIKGEFYSLSFEGIGDVIEIKPTEIHPLPDTVEKKWHYVSKGVHRLPEHLLVLLDLNLLIDVITKTDNPAAVDVAL